MALPWRPGRGQHPHTQGQQLSEVSGGRVQSVGECGSVGRVWKWWQSLECGRVLRFWESWEVLANIDVWESVKVFGECESVRKVCSGEGCKCWQTLE